MVGDDDADILVFQRSDDTLYILDGDRVHTRERLVEQNERRIDCHGTRNLGAAAFATRKLDTVTLADLLQTELLDKRLDALVLVLLGIIRHFEHRTDIVLDAQTAEHRRLLRQIADAELRTTVDRLLGEFDDFAVVVFEENLPLVGFDKTHYHIKRGSLARSVGTEQTDDFALLDVD